MDLSASKNAFMLLRMSKVKTIHYHDNTIFVSIITFLRIYFQFV